MTNFQELQSKRPELTKDLDSMTLEEMKEHYAREVIEKQELEEFKETYDDYQKDLECIVNAAQKWLKKNKKDKHELVITTEEIKLFYKHLETEWI
ncbi:hypothetical protein [uncultured Chryseobacterium sp.]|uniref:hypothetical protein n=1 Tax=uncultured Chryseobacterium sp. TaxID=259322 RepID=UPI0025D49D3E|nr:hypothetical protein [uncultured Chryseobacterium sp.]